MIYVTTTIEPEEGEEFEISNISIMRKKLDSDSDGKFRYNYGGSYKDKDGYVNYFGGYIYASREDNILMLIKNICEDALKK